MARGWPSGHDRRGWGALSWSTLSVLVRSGAPDHRGQMVRPAFLRGQGVTVKVAIRRCAVYTRKSSEEGLEQDFNSLHAQRDACEAFIRSQRGEGWRLVETGYDDGGLSGGTLERPALRQLFADIAQHRVDTVVVYKGRSPDPILDGLRQNRRVVRPACGQLCRGHPAVQHHDVD